MSRPATKAAAPPADGQLCTVLAVDIAGFTEPYRDDDIRLYLHSLVSPYDFQRVRFQVKQTRGRAWSYLPGVPVPA